jgi:hypothetical protein
MGLCILNFGVTFTLFPLLGAYGSLLFFVNVRGFLYELFPVFLLMIFLYSKNIIDIWDVILCRIYILVLTVGVVCFATLSCLMYSVVAKYEHHPMVWFIVSGYCVHLCDLFNSVYYLRICKALLTCVMGTSLKFLP